MSQIALMLLVAMPHGASLTLAPAEDLADCAARRGRVTAILRDNGAEIITARCGETEVTLSPYMHTAESGAARHPYSVRLIGEEGFEIVPGPCDAAAAETICADSTQAPE